MEVVFPFPQIFKIDLDSTRVDLPMLESKFRSFPAISLLARVGVGGWVGVGETEIKAKLSLKLNLKPCKNWKGGWLNNCIQNHKVAKSWRDLDFLFAQHFLDPFFNLFFGGVFR